MKKFFLVLVAGFATAATSWARVWPETLPAPLDKAYLPIGFDSNDVSQVVVEGKLSSSCQQVGPTAVKVDTVTRLIRLDQSVYQFPELCLALPTPYSQTVNIGFLPPGNYTVIDGFNQQVLGTLPVVEAPSGGPGVGLGIDNFVYALVSDASVSWDADSHRTLILDLKLPDSCCRLVRVDIHYYSDVIVVQPIAERSVSMECAPAFHPFRVTVPLRDDLSGRFLLHVRSMEGRALNKLIDIGAGAG